MKKRLLAVLCLLGLTAGLLTGCGDKASDAGKDASDLEYVELNWFTDLVCWGGPDAPQIVEKLNEYTMEKLNTKINIIDSDGDSSKLITLLGAGEDMIVAYDGMVDYTELVRQDALLPIDELLEEYAPKTKALFTEDEWNSMKVDGKIYAIPSKKDNNYPLGILYNKALVAELGLNMDEDFEFWSWKWGAEQEQYFMDAKAKRDELHPEWSQYALMSSPWDIPMAFGVEMLLNEYIACCDIEAINDFEEYDENTVFNIYETDAYREYCLMAQRMVAAGVYPYDYETEEEVLLSSPWGLGENSWGYVWLSDDFTVGDNSIALRMLDRPVHTDTAMYTTVANGISVHCKNPERAMMFLEMVNNDPYVATLIRFGIEGEHWITDDNGNMTMIGSPKNSDTNNYGFLQWYGASMGNMFAANVPYEFAGEDNYMMDQMEEVAKNTIIPAHMGFSPDTSSFSSELAAVTNVIAQYHYPLFKGQYESADAVNAGVDAFVADLKANGIDVVISEIQKQLDAWLKENK